ncbi:MAG TPA: MraY family glycosyltransferase [Actinomycetota bacterium]|nr:MraY family glycosyltransferase [Actinomycetota bacterium]
MPGLAGGPPLHLYLLVGLVAAAVSYLVTPAVCALSRHIGAIDVPTDRKVHLAPTPTLGGIAVYAAFVAACLFAAAFPSFREAFRFSELVGLVVGGIVPLALGIADDRRELSPPAKLAGQVFAAGILFLSGIRMTYFWLPGIGVLSVSQDVSAILTILWIVFLMNAVNFIDGLDGLCAGLTAIAAGSLFVYFTRLPTEFLGSAPIAPLVCVALVGACIGFLRYNFNPARIFLGDSGAMPLGYLLAGATISVIGTFNGPGSAGGRVALPMVFMPIVFLALPITDLVFAVVRRLATGRPIHTPDKEHIHHRLMRFGHSQREAVLVMYGWALLLAAGLVMAGVMPWGAYALAFAVAGGTVGLLTFAPRLRAPRQARGQVPQPAEGEVAPPPAQRV